MEIIAPNFMPVAIAQKFFGGLAPAHRSIMTSPGLKIMIKMSSIMPFTFNEVELCVVTEK